MSNSNGHSFQRSDAYSGNAQKGPAQQQAHASALRNVRYSPGAQARGAEIQKLSDYALASRLSYFLWSTMPDEQLMRNADQHVLHRPEVLRAQVSRMLKDARSEALTDNFAGQWLELRKLESDSPDHENFPEFDEYLRISMRQETELFLEDLVHNDRSILDSKSTFVNQKAR